MKYIESIVFINNNYVCLRPHQINLLFVGPAHSYLILYRKYNFKFSVSLKFGLFSDPFSALYFICKIVLIYKTVCIYKTIFFLIVCRSIIFHQVSDEHEIKLIWLKHVLLIYKKLQNRFKMYCY